MERADYQELSGVGGREASCQKLETRSKSESRSSKPLACQEMEETEGHPTLARLSRLPVRTRILPRDFYLRPVRFTPVRRGLARFGAGAQGPKIKKEADEEAEKE